jgi:saccharopine dehydrogenase (NAD+, L-lysine forming)
VEFYVQPSDISCFTDDEYKYLKIPFGKTSATVTSLWESRRWTREFFIPGKTYLFFAHVAKKQEHNLEMLREILSRKVKVIDYEYLTTDKGQRVVAFGRWAGIVGAYNALRARGIKSNRFKLKPAYQCHDLNEMWAGLRLIQLKPGLKILVTGEGRVANGAMETLANCTNLLKVHRRVPDKGYDVPVVCQVGPQHYVKHMTDARLTSIISFSILRITGLTS